MLLDVPKTLASGEMEVVGGTRSSDLLQSVVAGVAFLYVFLTISVIVHLDRIPPRETAGCTSLPQTQIPLRSSLGHMEPLD